ncbi:FMN-binding protein [Cetobacterium sp. 2A]|uniref:FMN-binding protein n=1 Tax=Cetobacterium sp. 2A TaxID=2754723 RepID=UPI00210787D1|nr:FMN-binding protein [Cetobacterium sp. 2A]
MIKKLLPCIFLAGMSLAFGAEAQVYQGLGKSANFRVGPGKDNKDVPVYSFNYVTAAGIFDKDGKIINIIVDGLEVSTPNYDGESMPHFSGWPGTPGYNVADHKTGEVSGVSENNVEFIIDEVSNWKTKRERGKDYGMNPRLEWHTQMDNFQKFFKGKTVAEVEEWFKKYTSDINGRPLKMKNKDIKDQQKYDKLNDTEKKELTDLVAGATMSIKDSHGDILGAIKNAYENRVEVNIPVK